MFNLFKRKTGDQRIAATIGKVEDVVKELELGVAETKEQIEATKAEAARIYNEMQTKIEMLDGEVVSLEASAEKGLRVALRVRELVGL